MGCTISRTIERQVELREAVVKRLGGKCKRCGYDAHIRALHIDHINGGGKRELRERFKNHRERYLKHLSTMDDIADHYQVLCANCNAIKRDELGENVTRKRAEPIDGKLREAVLAAKRKPGGQPGPRRKAA